MTRKTTKIDMHVHTRGSDGWGSPDDIVDYARAAKLDGVCLTDHHKTYTAESLEVARALRKAGLLAFHGCEYSTAWGHLLVYGVNVEQFSWGHYPDPRLVIRDVRAAGGVCVPAHPYTGYKRTYGDRVKRLGGIVGIEVANGQAAVRDPKANRQALVVAQERGLTALGGSDAHDPSYVGVCYTRFDAVIQTEREMLRVLKKGLARAVTTKKHVNDLLEQRRKVIRAAPLPVPLSAFLPGVSLDSESKSGQVPLDGERDECRWWGDPGTITH